jgi:hypothetical protein
MDDRTRERLEMNDKPLTDDKPENADFEADPNAAPAEEEQPTSFEQVLSKPIQAHGDHIDTLRWREPTGGDIERAGNPVYLDFSGPTPTITFNEKKMAAMMSVLCAIPPSSVRSLTAKDWNAVAWKLFRFFTPPGA